MKRDEAINALIETYRLVASDRCVGIDEINACMEEAAQILLALGVTADEVKKARVL